MNRLVLLLGVLCGVPLLGASEAPQDRGGEPVLAAEPEPLGDYSWEVAFPRLEFDRPVYLTHPKDGTDRIFVLEQDGIVRVFDNDPGASRADIALDFRSKVYRGHNEEGLLGMAFHPEFEKNRYVFLYYSANRPRRSVVSRFRMDRSGKKIDSRSERVIFEVKQPYGNHNGGMIEFGPDGYLYITLGDGGWANDPHGHGQNLGTLLGSILRIDVDSGNPYSIPDDNPFKDRRSARGEIWAYGLRNVWRFSFDRVTGTLWAGDVGQNKWEEIDVIQKGGNYGWNIREGAHRFKGSARGKELEEPVIEYSHRQGQSVTGGYVYRGRKLPGLVGVYLYADYETGAVWGLRWNGGKVIENERLGRGPHISSFGEDQNGEVYFCAFDGKIYRFVERSRERRGRLPRLLSETGLFRDTEDLKPRRGLVSYDVRVPQWVDGAGQERLLYLPEGKKIGVADDGTFKFPDGAAFVKTLFRGKGRDRRRMETQVLVHSGGGWSGHTYAWDPAQKDAYLIESRGDLPVDAESRRGRRRRRAESLHWTFAAPSDCMSCHTSEAGGVLGFRPEQVDFEELSKRGIFEGEPSGAVEPYPEWSDSNADAAKLVRAYLEVNCASCHRPGAPGQAGIDLRASTPLEKTGLVDAQPAEYDLGVRAGRLIKPGRPKRSLLYLRIQRSDALGMPPLGNNVPNETALERIEDWIKELE